MVAWLPWLDDLVTLSWWDKLSVPILSLSHDNFLFEILEAKPYQSPNVWRTFARIYNANEVLICMNTPSVSNLFAEQQPYHDAQ